MVVAYYVTCACTMGMCTHCSTHEACSPTHYTHGKGVQFCMSARSLVAMSVSNLVGQDVLKLVEVWSQECC